MNQLRRFFFNENIGEVQISDEWFVQGLVWFRYYICYLELGLYLVEGSFLVEVIKGSLYKFCYFFVFGGIQGLVRLFLGYSFKFRIGNKYGECVLQILFYGYRDYLDGLEVFGQVFGYCYQLYEVDGYQEISFIQGEVSFGFFYRFNVILLDLIRFFLVEI